ncbi:MAG TPA: trehalase family glycosidase [bacterium]|nr:trehalase family glycosidase [bacterium]
MKHIFYNISLSALNGIKRKLSGKWLKEESFDINLPDEKINSSLKSLFNELDSRVSLPVSMKHSKDRWLRASANESSASSTESAFASRIIAPFDSDLATEILKPFFHNQSDEGNIPSIINIATTSSIPTTPFIIESVSALHRFSALPDIQEVFERIQKYFDWLVLHKKESDGLYIRANTRWFNSDDFINELRRESPKLKSKMMDVRSVALNSMMAMQLLWAADIAAITGREKEARKFQDMHSMLRTAMIEHLWSDNEQFFYDSIRGEIQPGSLIGGFSSLGAMIPSKDQAGMMMRKKEILKEKLPLISNFPGLSTGIYSTVNGMIKYGYHREAADLAWEFITFANTLPHTSKHFITRLVSGLLVMNVIIGFRDFGDRQIINPGFPDQWKNKTARIHREKEGYSIFVAMDNDDNITVRVITSSGIYHETEIKNLGFTTLIPPKKSNGNEVANKKAGDISPA